MSKFKIKKSEHNLKIDSDAIITYKETGKIKEIRYMLNNNIGGNIKKISKNEYVDISTGEIKEFKHNENRSLNKMGISKSLKRLRDIINTNITNPSKALWATLTYRENMTDNKRLYEDFRKFNMRFKYYIKKLNYPKYEYVAVQEPQARGAWHMHIVFVFSKKAPFIENKKLADLWGHGFVSIKSLKNVDNIGAYLSAYLGDMELSESLDKIKDTSNVVKKEIIDEKGNKSEKYYVKGARLSLYPVGCNIYRRSKGIKEPVIEKCTYKEALEKVKGSKLSYENTIDIFDNDGKFINKICYKQYKK